MNRVQHTLIILARIGCVQTQAQENTSGTRLSLGGYGEVAMTRNLIPVTEGLTFLMRIGCATCHRPSWKTGNDNYWKPAVYADKELPRYQEQTIWPYTDMIQHRLYMKNGIHGSWCRTTPLWGRGLSRINTGAEDRLHDNRARDVIEAIMWHGYSKESDAYWCTEKFYNLSKEERDAVVEFINSI